MNATTWGWRAAFVSCQRPFSLEALDARSGDALLLFHGPTSDPSVVIIDGGFGVTWVTGMRPRLGELRDARGLADDESFDIDLVVVSHIDQDHINGVVRLFREVRDTKESSGFPLWNVTRLWHNSFDDAIEELTGGTPVSAAVISRASAVAASVNDAPELRDLAEQLGVAGNPPFGGLVVAPATTVPIEGLQVTVVGPTSKQLEDLKREWEREVRREHESNNTARVAAYVDDAVANLSSIVLHVTQGDQSMLLAGDARGDAILEGLEAAELCETNGTLHVDILKVPHHGSDRTVELGFFQRVTADHYVISADGRHDNPSLETLKMLVDARGADSYTVHLTHDAGTDAFFRSDRDTHERSYKVRVRPPGDGSISVDLADCVVT